MKTNTIIVHRRVGRSRIRSKYDIAAGTKGKWALLCGRYTTRDVNTTTKVEQVTCMTCLKKMKELPPIEDFMEYMDKWKALDREYDRIPSWRIIKALRNIRKREKLTEAWTARMREAGVEV